MAKLYIFDFDGTLTDTMRLWDNMTRRFLSSYGIEITDETLDFLNTLHYERCLECFIDELGVPEKHEEIAAVWYDFAVAVFRAEAVVLPGAADCLDRLRAGGAAIALFTLSPRGLVEMLLDKLELADKFDRTFMSGETEHPKSSPESFLEIARTMGVKPGETAVVEDSPYACESARLAGMRTYGVCIGNKHAGVIENMCDVCIYDYSELT